MKNHLEEKTSYALLEGGISQQSEDRLMKMLVKLRLYRKYEHEISIVSGYIDTGRWYEKTLLGKILLYPIEISTKHPAATITIVVGVATFMLNLLSFLRDTV